MSASKNSVLADSDRHSSIPTLLGAAAFVAALAMYVWCASIYVRETTGCIGYVAEGQCVQVHE